MPYLVTGEPAPARPEGALEPDPSFPRVCVIGGGSSGITVAKALYEARVPFDCFEKGPYIGGNWVFENPNRQSACYRTLEMNTSGPRMAFSDFPLDNEDYPAHEEVRDYFERYVDHFGIRDTITFETEVERVVRREDGVWDVTIAGAGARGGREKREYDAVVVANGHHWDARWPDPPFPGSFDGLQLHAHDYRGPEIFEGKRVVVVGGGNSGMDIARDAGRAADAAFLSLRRGVHVLRKRLGGKPIDQTLPPTWIPWWLKQKGLEMIRWRSGDVSRYGTPEPDHKVGHAHPTVSDEIHDSLEAGQVTPKPNIRELRGDSVEFEDGSVEPVDVIVYCTGYKVTFPFFDEQFISAPGNDMRLFRRTFDPGVPGVYFVGLMQPLGAIMPIAEEQGRWIADLLRGRYRLPSEDQMNADIERERAAHAKRFYSSARHTMEIDFDEWLAGVARGAKARRAARGPRRAPPLDRAPGAGAEDPGGHGRLGRLSSRAQRPRRP